MRSFVVKTAHLLTWSLGLAIVTALIVRAWWAFLLCFLVSLTVQAFHSVYDHPNQLFAREWVGGIIGAATAITVLLCAISVGGWPALAMSLGVLAYDVSIHERRHRPNVLLAAWPITIGAAAIVGASSLVLRYAS